MALPEQLVEYEVPVTRAATRTFVFRAIFILAGAEEAARVRRLARHAAYRVIVADLNLPDAAYR
jgi:hypothetical protein